MNIETGTPKAATNGMTEPVVFRSEHYELRMPQSAMATWGSEGTNLNELLQAAAAAANTQKEIDTPPQTNTKQPEKTIVTAKEAMARLHAEKQDYWRKIFQTGEYTIYDRERKPIKFDALRDASYELVNNPAEFIKHFGEHVGKIDYEFRGEKDIGDAKMRLQRVGALLGMIAVFTAFDRGTSEPWELFKKHYFPTEGKGKTYQATVGAVNKLIEVMNDKYATALGNMWVEKLTGKRGFVHEVADKGADTLTVGLDGWDDWVNGPTLESTQRILFQIPIAGALLEQGLTRLSLLQEKSPLHTATGKMIYMAVGVFMRVNEIGKPKVLQPDA